MSVKEKIKKEIDFLPETELRRLYSYIQNSRKKRKRKSAVINSENKEWEFYPIPY